VTFMIQNNIFFSLGGNLVTDAETPHFYGQRLHGTANVFELYLHHIVATNIRVDVPAFVISLSFGLVLLYRLCRDAARKDVGLGIRMPYRRVTALVFNGIFIDPPLRDTWILVDVFLAPLPARFWA